MFMIRKAFISINFSNFNKFSEELDVIKNTLTQMNVEYILFVEKYKFSSSQEKIMMKKTFEEIDQCSLLIAEVSDKAIGVGIEIGYAKAKKIPILYLRRKKAEHSTTAAGTANDMIVYASAKNLQIRLVSYLEENK